MASALVGLANITLGADQQILTFTSISGIYRDLYLVYVYNTYGGVPAITFNNDSTNGNYTSVSMAGNGSSATSTAPASNNWYDTNTVQSGAGKIMRINIMDYSATDKHKTLIARADLAASGTEAKVTRWASTAAITSIKLDLSAASSSFLAGATFALYGVSS